MAFIASPPGTGKTSWVKTSDSGFRDQDEWAKRLGIHTEEWHTRPHTEAETELHYKNINAYTEAARKQGIRLIGALYTDGIRPDALVLIDVELHRQRCEERDDLDWAKVVEITEWMTAHANANGVTIFKTFDEARKCVV
jgi:hypothetical protein